MAASPSIKTFSYDYCDPNGIRNPQPRQIQFLRPESTSEVIEAHVFKLNNEGEVLERISTIAENKIHVFWERRDEPVFSGNFSELSVDQKLNVLSSLIIKNFRPIYEQSGDSLDDRISHIILSNFDN